MKERLIKYGISILSGLLIALSLPPFKLWFLAFIGFALFSAQLYQANKKLRFELGFLCAFVQFLISLNWVTGFSIPGYLVLTIVYSFAWGATSLVVSSSTFSKHAVSFIPAFTLIDYLKTHFPFGGLPIGSFSIGEVSSPFASSLTVGGETLLSLITVTVGVILHGLLSRHRNEKNTASTTIVIAIIIGSLDVLGTYSTSGASIGSISVAIPQGGGTRGLRAVINGNEEQVFNNAVNATLEIPKSKKLNLILWPEDVVGLDTNLKNSIDSSVISNLAITYHATLIAGVTEPSGSNSFLNLAVAYGSNGKITGSYLKVHRVPFGEYVPMRSFFAHFGNVSLVPKNAVAGTKPGLLVTAAGKLGVMISYECFYGNRALASIDAGATVLIVPTNTASYKSIQVPLEEVYASRIRAIETGRDLAQAAPTGYSAVITRNGNIKAMSNLGNMQVVYGTLNLYKGKTIYDNFGPLPTVFICIFLLLLVLLFNLKSLHLQKTKETA